MKQKEIDYVTEVRERYALLRNYLLGCNKRRRKLYRRIYKEEGD